jgi:hypothetical protein
MLSQDTVLKIFRPILKKAKTNIQIYPANHISGDSIHFPHFSAAMPRRLGERHVELLQRLIRHGEIRDAVSETFERSLDQDGARAAASRQRC